MAFPPRIVDLSGNYTNGIADNGGGNPLNQLVYHFTVSGSRAPIARNLVAAIHTGRAGGATQVFIDDSEVVITGPARRQYWATGSALNHNATTYNIEICGTTGSTWLDPSTPAGQAFRNAAWWGARCCHEYEIEPRLLTVAETRNPNRSGITTHYRISIADGPGGSDHTDWDDSEPVGQLVELTRKFYADPNAPAYAGQEAEEEDDMFTDKDRYNLDQTKAAVGWLQERVATMDRQLSGEIVGARADVAKVAGLDVGALAVELQKAGAVAGGADPERIAKATMAALSKLLGQDT